MPTVLQILRISTAALFFGRGYQHIFWNTPYRTFLWKEEVLAQFVENYLGMSWYDYATNLNFDVLIESITSAMGILYIFIGVVCLFIKKDHKKLGVSLFFGSGLIFFLVLHLWAGKFFYIAMLIEHGLQIGAPLVLYVAIFRPEFFYRYMIGFKFMIAATFIGHGMFAIGIHPVPGHFIDMIISTFGVSEGVAKDILVLAGTLDFVASIMLFIPKTQFYALGFTIFWGTTTAFARIVSNFALTDIGLVTHQWLLETLYRFPHGFVPLAILLYLKHHQVSSERALKSLT